MASIRDNLANKVKWTQLSAAERTDITNAGWNRATWTSAIATAPVNNTSNTAPPPSTTAFQKLETLATDRLPKDQATIGDLEDMAKVLKDIKNVGFDINANMSTVLNMLALEDTLRVDISQSLGMSNEQLLDTIDGLTEAALQASRFGLRTNDLYATFKAISEEVQRNLFIPPKVTERAALLTKTLKGFDAGQFAKGFDDIGFSLDTAMGKVDETDNAMSDILKTGREFGVVMEKFLQNIGDELKLINTFGFERGIEGLARMVARGQALGISMSQTTSLAEKFFDPEGAIEFAAQMQVIGGAVGDLQDPFKLMYMATNDLEGLQEAIIDTAAAAATFDEEKGKFVISPEQRRQMMAMKDQLGMSYQELADLAVKSARRAEVFNQIGDFSDMSETDKELLSSMAAIGKGGVAQVKIPGIEEMVDVADVTESQMELLRKEGMTDSDVYKQQLTVAEKANQYLAAMDAGIRIMIKAGGVTDQGIKRETLTQTIASAVPGLTPQDLEDLRAGEFDNIQAKIVGAGAAGAQKALDELKKMSANDALITEEGMTTFAKGDMHVVAQTGNVKLNEDLDTTMESTNQTLINSIKENTTTNTTTNDMRGVKLELSGNINVNEGQARMDGQAFLKLLEMDSTTAAAAGAAIHKALGTVS